MTAKIKVQLDLPKLPPEDRLIADLFVGGRKLTRFERAIYEAGRIDEAHGDNYEALARYGL